MKTQEKEAHQGGNPWIIAGGIVAVTLGTSLFFYLKDRKANKEEVDQLLQMDGDTQGFETVISFGRKGEMVRLLQKALIDKYGTQILPRFGADGIWGKETQTALSSMQLPTSFSSPASLKRFVKMLGTSSLSGLNGSLEEMAQLMAMHINSRDFSQTLGLLVQIESLSEFESISKFFQTLFVLGEKRVLTKALSGRDMFWNPTQFKTFQKELIRIGLRFHPLSDSWVSPSELGQTSSGLRGKQVFSNRTSLVWDGRKSMMEVPTASYLGTAFELNGEVLLFITPSGRFLFTRINSVSLQ